MIEIPREVIHAIRMKPLELKQELAIHLFQQGRLSFGPAGEAERRSASKIRKWMVDFQPFTG
ncbi:MAG: UPF0175 family protein [Acidobacteria bacterium]|nr:UPF0175 family protein [Acidobacteriota bacterium]